MTTKLVEVYDDFELLLDRGAELIQFYRHDPVMAALDLLKVDLAPVQRIILRDMWFKNFVITVAGRGLGKSSSIDSLTYIKNKGLVYLYEILPSIPTYLATGDDEVIECDEIVYTSDGFRCTKRVALEKKIEGCKVVTDYGFEHKGSKQHALLTLNTNCEFEYKPLSELQVGDKICIQRGQRVFGTYKFSLDDAYLIGLLIGDSSASDSVPIIIRQGTIEVQIAFLQGYFDANSTFNSGRLTCLSTSYKFLKEIQLMLLNLGIVSRLRRSEDVLILDVVSYNYLLFNYLIGSRLDTRDRVTDSDLNVGNDIIPYGLKLCSDIIEYYNSTYFDSTKLSFNMFFNTKKGLTYIQLYNFLKQCEFIEDRGFSLSEVEVSLDKLASLFYTHYFFDEVKSVERWEGDCYDFEMDMDVEHTEPNYFANGFINHNTFLLGVNALLHALLYPGYRIGLIGPSFRQCLVLSHKPSVFITSKGIMCSTKELYDNINIGDSIFSLERFNEVKNKWINYNRKCIRLECEKGFSIEGDENHRVLIWTGLGFDYKKLESIDSNDYLVIRSGMEEFLDDSVENGFITNELAYCLGLICMHGSIENEHLVYLRTTDEDIINVYSDVIYKQFGVKPSIRRDYSGCFIAELYNKDLCNLFKSVGVSYIPSILYKCNKDKWKWFLRGLYDVDGDCCVVTSDSGEVLTVDYTSANKFLCKTLQAILLNFGIVSILDVEFEYDVTKIGDAQLVTYGLYKLRITGQDNINKFVNEIGFNINKKQVKLLNYVNTSINLDDDVVIQNSSDIVNDLISKLAKHVGIDKLELISKIKPCEKEGFFRHQIINLLRISNTHGFKSYEYYILKLIIENNLFFVRPLDKSYFYADTVDIEVDIENAYWCNGFINHNSKMIFSEIEKLYRRSSIVREAAEKKPVRGADTCYLQFKGTDRSNGSFIEALPVGVDGAKIRGSRFYLIEVDELAQMPSEIIDLVITPMAAVSLEPMQRVRELERQRELVALGLATEEDFIDNMANKMIMTSSGYFKFNHMWERMKAYWRAIEEGEEDKYAVHQIPYKLLPEGFLDEENIKKAKRTMSTIEFMMEYEAAMVSDSSGFFKASLVEECSLKTGFTIHTSGVSDNEYVLGVDPNQAGRAAAGIVVLQAGPPHKIVYVERLNEKTIQNNVKHIQRLLTSFNIVGMYMDSMGGGKAWKDLLQEGYDGFEPILDVKDKDNQHMSGRRILHLLNPTVQWISDANFNLLALLENKDLLFPELPLTSSAKLEKLYEEVKVLKSQLVNIVVTQTTRGVAHFDTPKRDQNKDLYSALVLASWGVKEVLSQAGIQTKVLHDRGFVRPHTPGAKFDTASLSNSSYPHNAAILKRIN